MTSLYRSHSYEERLGTFTIWSLNISPSPEALSRAGFSYTQEKDKVKCHVCGGKLYNWKENDDPVIEHLRYFPDCTFLKKLFQDEKEMGQRNLHPLPQQFSGVDQEWLQSQVDKPITHIVLSQGCSSNDIVQVIVERFKKSQTGFSDAASLLKAVYELQDRQAATTLSKTKPANTPVAAKPSPSEGRQCVLCSEKEIGALFLPCGHFNTCTNCAVRVTASPTCHLVVMHRLRVYLC